MRGSFTEGRYLNALSIVEIFSDLPLLVYSRSNQIFQTSRFEDEDDCEYQVFSVEKFTVTCTANDKSTNLNLYHLTKISLKLSFTVYFKYTEISRYTTVLSISIFLSLEILDVNLMFADVCHLPYAWTVVCVAQISLSNTK